MHQAGLRARKSWCAAFPRECSFAESSQWRVAHPHFLTVAGAAEALAGRPHLFPVSPRPLNATEAPDAERILRDIRFPCLRARGRGNQHFCKPERKSYASPPTRGALVKTHARVFSFAMTRCTGHFAAMTQEDIGKNGEPFFPKEMLSAMVVAGRELICPGLSKRLSKLPADWLGRRPGRDR